MEALGWGGGPEGRGAGLWWGLGAGRTAPPEGRAEGRAGAEQGRTCRKDGGGARECCGLVGAQDCQAFRVGGRGLGAGCQVEPSDAPAHLSCPLQEHKAKVTELEQQVAQAKTRYSVALRNLEQISEQIHARRRGLPAHPPGPRRSSPVGAEAGPESLEDGDSGIEGAEGGGLEEGGGLGPGPGADTDTLSLLSLRTVASDLQKCDSVEHLRGLSDHASLDGQELGPRSGGRRGSDGGARGGRHQRSVSL